VKQVSQAGHSRVPLYGKDVDEIVGVLYAKDVLEHWATPEAGSLTLSRIARKPFFVPETKRISQLLDEFKRTQTHMAVVIDEYGGTAGLITIEDILEEIVGEIEDEFDESVDVPLLSLIEEGTAEASGHVHVDDLGDALDVEIPSEDFDTVGGLVFAALGRIPEAGEEFDFAGVHFKVLEADERRVNRVKAVRTDS
jgi:CBS domain containing-hemolysin-like protein